MHPQLLIRRCCHTICPWDADDDSRVACRALHHHLMAAVPPDAPSRSCFASAQFPAGLIDEGETAAEAAVRELKEETGYSGTVGRTSTVCFSDPGLTNANMQVDGVLLCCLTACAGLLTLGRAEDQVLHVS